MKSSKLKATLAAVSAIAVMASASTSFAAATVTTKSTYNASSDKVSVEATVSGIETNKEVTYLVNNGAGDIVYIDQATATTGSATFSYKIDKTKIKDLKTTVKYGTDGSVAAPAADDLGFKAVNATENENVTITYKDKDGNVINGNIVAGIDEIIYATVEANEGYEITSVAINSVDQGDIKSVYELKAGETITVTTKEKTMAPVVVANKPTVDNDVADIDGKAVNASVTTVLNVTGAADEYGVLYTVNGELTAFPAAAGENNYAAVRILTTDNETITLDQVIPYYKVNGTYYNATDGADLSK